MVLKVREIVDKDTSTCAEIDTYKGNIKRIRKYSPLANTEAHQTLIITYKDNSEEMMTLAIWDKEDKIYKPQYKFVFLMNDKGETIERII